MSMIIKLTTFLFFAIPLLYNLIAFSISYKHNKVFNIQTRVLELTIVFFKEYCITLLFILFIICEHFLKLIKSLSKNSVTQFQTYTNTDNNIIILIHAMSMVPQTFFRFKKQLIQKGHTNILYFKYNHLNNDIKGLANNLKKQIDGLNKSKNTKITFICHSMGGLIARYYLSNLKGYLTTNKLITISTPHKGSNLAFLGFTKCAKDMRPNSNFYKSLKKLPEHISILSIYSRTDQMVSPGFFCKIEEKTNKRNFEIKREGHLSILLNKKSIKLIIDWLEEKEKI